MLLAAAAAGSAADAPLATLTIQDGDARLIRDAAVWRPAEGLRLVAGDIVETTTATRLVRLELADGHAIDLGPATRVQLAPQLRERGRAQPAFYLLDGWVKLTQSSTARADAPLLGSRALDVQQFARDVVLAVRGDTGWAFAESGAVTLAERHGGQPAATVALMPGQFFERRGSAAKPVVAARPSAEFLQQVPRAFRDTLPLRAALFKTRQAAPKRLAAITYEDVRPWLAAEPALRRGFVSRWRGAAREAAFRRALAEHLDAHPEWDRVLHPEKYRPKQPAKTPAPRY